MLVVVVYFQLERKRHIGNDIVNIVFLDGTPEEMAAFSPNCIKSQFTRIQHKIGSIFCLVSFSIHFVLDIFALVTYLPGEDAYRFHIYSEESVPLFGPSLPSPPIFPKVPDFREFLLVKRTSKISADNDRLILTSRQTGSNLFWPITFSLLFWVDGLSYPIRGGWQSLMARRQLSTRPSSHRNVNGLWTCSLETCTPRSWRNIAG